MTETTGGHSSVQRNISQMTEECPYILKGEVVQI
jgi:uncharacterized cupin superfamily protein